MYAHVHVCIHTYVCVHVCMHACMYVWMPICILYLSVCFQVDTRLQGFLDKTIKDYYTGTTFDSEGNLGDSIEPFSAAWDFAMAYVSDSRTV